MKMRNLTPQQIGAKWIQKLRAAAQDYKNAINALQDNPLERAAQKEAQWGQACLNAANNQRFSQGLRRVTFQDWKTRAAQIGGDRIANMPDLKQQKFVAFMTRFMPVLRSAQQAIQAMPRDTYEQRMARQRAMSDFLHNARQGLGNQGAAAGIVGAAFGG